MDSWEACLEYLVYCSIVLHFAQALVRGMPQLPVMRPSTILDRSNQLRPNIDGISFPTGFNGGLAGDDLIHPVPEFESGTFVEAGCPYPTDVD
ncbi:hypothetical protein SAMN05216228_1010184 [Rhizobium tibeticum]|uniref:Uncharacterized protein n=1 Tax=Rhizobium tibeticum TaxID=501024 RepID=A0A1H8LB46_9HYPH|nr:hypothetical protein RTCCBAU85039_2826 [Rhizobium tibeticum]SEO02026.1 hypothetical protein SAMN05216228_1010184 [Rhizobium tibeticum]